MARRERWHFIAMDTHIRTTDIHAQDDTGREVLACRVPTTIPNLAAVVEKVPRPRLVVFEEGSLAGWLQRCLRPYADNVIVAEPRRNAYIAKDGSKDDPIDARKLAELARGGYLKAVHHPDSEDRVILKRLAILYRAFVRERVRFGNMLVAELRIWGIVATLPETSEEFHEITLRLPKYRPLRALMREMFVHYQDRCELHKVALGPLLRLAQREEIVRRWCDVPGIGPIRSATLLAFLDTHERFPRKKGLFAYLGIGLQKKQSGSGAGSLGVGQTCSRTLRNVIIGAAQRAIDLNNNPFADNYRRLTTQGQQSHRNARRSVARVMAAALMSMWKHATRYDPRRVGRQAVK